MTAPERLPAAAIALLVAGAAELRAADTRAKAEVTCAPTAQALQYDCTIRLTDARTGTALSGINLAVGADMPSMPIAHNVRPARAQAAGEPGVYTARIDLEMHGDWTLRLDITGPVRDRVIERMRFEPGSAAKGDSAGAPPAPPHKH